MRIFRALAVLPVILITIALVIFAWYYSRPPRAGHLDAYAVSRILSTCHWQSQCIIRVGDLFQGDWDTFHEFGPAIPQAQVDRILRPASVQKGDTTTRLLVLTRDGRVIQSEREATGTGLPLDGEVDFGGERYRNESIIQFTRSTRLEVNAFPTRDSAGHDGTFYVLTPLD